MNKNCGRCEKIVYPIEELKCLDKVWHKGCFKCHECGMTLSMKTYKGYDKLPYCESHIPKAKATTVAETPETKRLAENTKIQSNVIYHADFEKNKAKFTQVADDPETLRIKQNTKIFSNISYHGDLEKKALMEQKRSEELTENVKQVTGTSKEEKFQNLQSSQNQAQSVHSSSQPAHLLSQPANVQSKPDLHQSQPAVHSSHHQQQIPAQSAHQQQPLYRGVSTQPPKQVSAPQHSQYHHQQQHVPPNTKSYYPTNMTTQGYHRHPQQNAFQDANHNSPYSARTAQTLIYSSQSGGVQQQSATAAMGRIADYDPINDQYGSISSQKRNQQPSGGYRQETTYQAQRGNMYPEGQEPQQQPGQGSIPQKVSAPPTQLGKCFRAIYDYEAADTDEVSFRDGDLLINCTSIDEGWMTGIVQRTGRAGMLPANYVERVS